MTAPGDQEKKSSLWVAVVLLLFGVLVLADALHTVTLDDCRDIDGPTTGMYSAVTSGLKSLCGRTGVLGPAAVEMVIAVMLLGLGGFGWYSERKARRSSRQGDSG